MLKTFRKKFIGDKKFYFMVLGIAIPIMVQNGITNFVNLLDNIMVGQIGTEQMSGVAIVNQLCFVYNLCIFGGLAGSGIFTAQYFGHGDDEGVRHTFRFKVWIAILLVISATILFIFAGEQLIQQFLTGSSDGGDLEATLVYGRQYLNIMLLGLPAFSLVQIYASTLRECGETLVPMKAGIAAVFVNLVFNYLLIFGHFGFPEMGVVGAGLATVISRYVEVAIVVTWTHKHTEKNTYIVGIYRTLKVPMVLVKKLVLKGCPLLINEAMWSCAMTMLVQCYSVRGLSVVAGLNIANTINNLFNIVYLALGDSVAIVVGQLLGANKLKEARDKDNKMLAFSTLSCFAVGAVLLCVAPFFPHLYNTTEESRHIATQLITVQALAMPIHGFLHAAYFTLRSGGKTIVTFFFDGVFVWVVSVPIAFILSRFTGLPVVWIFIMVQVGDCLKALIGFILVKKGVWIQNIVAEDK